MTLIREYPKKFKIYQKLTSLEKWENIERKKTLAILLFIQGTTLSGVEFELAGSGYRVSLVKRRFVSGN